MVIILMGVSGSGKTTVGRLLASQLGWQFYEGDDFHPQANIDKMQQGIPLTDDDRWPWLAALRAVIDLCSAQGTNAVLVCSALKQSYRDYLMRDHHEITLVYLKGTYDLLYQRLAQRQGHFMPKDLLISQFATLEEPQQGLTVDVANAPERLVAEVRQALQV
jgi:carbohydrate kinase (thermoresistant glucokinase family)